MLPNEFLAYVHITPGLSYVGVKSGEVLVRYNGTEGMLAVAPEEILRAEWSELLPVLLGQIEPDPLRHCTRIVGYYSMTRNWNGSALAQLRDRKRGRDAPPSGIAWSKEADERVGAFLTEVLTAAGENTVCSL